MLIDLTYLIKKYRPKITGAIHVGAHYGEEYEIYIHNKIYDIVFIEASKVAFDILSSKSFGLGTVLLNVACGSYAEKKIMHVETFNKGQSNSLLKPAKHLEHYPLIVFDKTEEVQVIPLDNLMLKAYNFLNMDVQGYELEVLKGATETLNHIDYIYTEVNVDEVYEGCAKLKDIDQFLKGFTRVETVMTRQGWGDAFFISKKLK